MPDTLEDERFSDNPLVTGAPDIRFYAGAPLKTSSGHRLGTLCAIDSKPRSLTPREENLLCELAAIVVDEMELSAALGALGEQAEELVQRNTALDAFVHTLSHDLAGPMRRIKSFCDLLEKDSSIPIETALEAISGSAASVSRLLEDLRTFLVVQTDDKAEDCELQSCFETACEILAEELDASSARIVVVDELPRVRFFRAPLVVLFTNLIGNAVKYRSERPLLIEVGVHEREDRWEVSVADNGIGIPEKYQERVFALLARLHRQDEIPGSGLGLAICQNVVRPRRR